MHKVCFEKVIDQHSTYRDLLTRIKVGAKQNSAWLRMKNRSLMHTCVYLKVTYMYMYMHIYIDTFFGPFCTAFNNFYFYFIYFILFIESLKNHKHREQSC